LFYQIQEKIDFFDIPAWFSGAKTMNERRTKERRRRRARTDERHPSEEPPRRRRRSMERKGRREGNVSRANGRKKGILHFHFDYPRPTFSTIVRSVPQNDLVATDKLTSILERHLKQKFLLTLLPLNEHPTRNLSVCCAKGEAPVPPPSHCGDVDGGGTVRISNPQGDGQGRKSGRGRQSFGREEKEIEGNELKSHAAKNEKNCRC
jgi:hypothetical protein